MQKFIWLWKHRHCWEQLKYLYEQRIELKRILRSIHISVDAPSEFQADEEKDPQTIDSILERLREFDRVPLIRSWNVSPSMGGKVEPPRAWPERPNMPRPKQKRMGKVTPTGPMPRGRNRPVPKQRIM